MKLTKLQADWKARIATATEEGRPCYVLKPGSDATPQPFGVALRSVQIGWERGLWHYCASGGLIVLTEKGSPFATSPLYSQASDKLSKLARKRSHEAAQARTWDWKIEEHEVQLDPVKIVPVPAKEYATKTGLPTLRQFLRRKRGLHIVGQTPAHVDSPNEIRVDVPDDIRPDAFQLEDYRVTQVTCGTVHFAPRPPEQIAAKIANPAMNINTLPAKAEPEAPAKPKPTFNEVEEMACMVHDAMIEAGRNEEDAKAAAQQVWRDNPHV